MKDLTLNSSLDLRNEGKSFYWASFFLPKKYKFNAGTLYSICRYFDNVADKDSDDMSLFLKDSINEIKKNKKNAVNIFLTKNKINILIFSDLIEGLIQDQKKTNIRTEKDLINYSYCVAGTVGLMMSKIIGVTDKNAFSSAIDLGIAMQLTNIARDVSEDAKMQRIYLPSELIPNINLEILTKQTTVNLEDENIILNAVHKIINLSYQYYVNGFAGLRYIPLKTRLGIFIAANIYMGIGTKIKKSGNKFLMQRIYLNSFEKFFITIKSIFIFLIIPLMNYKYSQIRDKLPNENL